jgi:hypothetical protein
VVIYAGIHMTDIPSFPYRLSWEKRIICSVARGTPTGAAVVIPREGHTVTNLLLAPGRQGYAAHASKLGCPHDDEFRPGHAVASSKRHTRARGTGR